VEEELHGSFEEKVAVVTGAAYGNGRGMAVRFAEEGADIDADRMQETARLANRGTYGRRTRINLNRKKDCLAQRRKGAKGNLSEMFRWVSRNTQE
jgi:NAD(P)-dependent dehydrogenase (short-subunit alcohol dehydrogenase family)